MLCIASDLTITNEGSADSLAVLGEAAEPRTSLVKAPQASSLNNLGGPGPT